MSGPEFAGVMMRGGVSAVYPYPDRTLRDVHPARLGESIGYRIFARGLRVGETVMFMDRPWDHYLYTFNYRRHGRSLDVTWRCGTGYGDPKPWDGLWSAMEDAASTEWDSLDGWIDTYGYDEEIIPRRKLEQMYRACERMGERLDRFFGDSEDRELWRRALEQMNR